MPSPPSKVDRPVAPPRDLTRRACLGLLVVGGVLGPGSRAWPQPPAGDADEGEAAAVDALGRKAGLGRFGKDRSPHFLALGDAPDAFRQSALRHCEALGEDFQRHFKDKGFQLAFPPRRLTVVVLKHVSSYEALLGEAPGKDVGGHYDVDSNRLVIFDFRLGKDVQAAVAERLNLFTLVHETAHQLTFNTGLLSRTATPPVALSEGLATYVELWKPGVRNAIGRINEPRLRALRQAEDWIVVADLLADDRLFQGPQEQLAYAEAWLLVHHFLRSTTQVPRLRAYLEDLQSGAKSVPALAEKRLGPLGKLDKILKDEARKYLRG